MEGGVPESGPVPDEDLDDVDTGRGQGQHPLPDMRGDPAAGYAILVPDLELEKALSLPRDRKILFRNGGIRVAAIIRRP